MFGWYLGLIGITIGIIGGIYFLVSLFSMEGELKTSISCLVCASTGYLLFSGLMVFLGLTGNNNLESLSWQAVPIIFFLSTIFFIIGSLKLVNLVSNLSQKKGVKKK